MKYKETILKEEVNKALALQRRKKYKEAIAVLKELDKKLPNSPVINGLIANMYYFEDKYRFAIKYYKKTLSLNPKAEVASSALFHCLNSINKADEALAELKRFLSNTNELKKNNYKWILSDLLADINNPLLIKHKVIITNLAKKFNVKAGEYQET